MIHISRDAVAAPPGLVEEDSPGKNELARALTSLAEHHALPEPKDKWTFGFKAYKRDDVKTALTALFKGKCAYCETRYAATQPMDVEHWRPKGQIDDGENDPIAPGYYWLAATWENLLPSCIDCNRRRFHIDVETDKPAKLGKLDQFPLSAPSSRASSPGKEVDEVPLLINPCLDDPSTFFTYSDDAVILPADEAETLERLRARESIRVYALNRSGLVQNRLETLVLAKLSVGIVKALGELLSNPDRSEGFRIIVDQMIASELRSLARRSGPDQPYSLMVRQFVEREIGELPAVEG